MSLATQALKFHWQLRLTQRKKTRGHFNYAAVAVCLFACLFVCSVGRLVVCLVVWLFWLFWSRHVRSCRNRALCTNLPGQRLWTDPKPLGSTTHSKNCVPSRAEKLAPLKCEECSKMRRNFNLRHVTLELRHNQTFRCYVQV